MNRYFFDIGSNARSTRGDSVELPDLKAVRREALETACGMIRESEESVWGGHPWRLAVTDEDGAFVCQLELSAKTT